MKVFLLICLSALILNGGYIIFKNIWCKSLKFKPSNLLVFAQKKPHPKLGNVQKSMGDVLSFIDGENFSQATKSHDDGLISLGLNTEAAAPFYAALKSLRKELLKNTRATDSDKKQLKKKLISSLKPVTHFYIHRKALKTSKLIKLKRTISSWQISTCFTINLSRTYWKWLMSQSLFTHISRRKEISMVVWP